MAKSLRSKWKRKMRAVKRERYGKKELDKLRMIVSAFESSKSNPDITMTSIQDLVTVVNKPNISEQEEGPDHDEEVVMELGENAPTKKKVGEYPIWIGSAKRKKLIKQNRKNNKIKKKEIKKQLRKHK